MNHPTGLKQLLFFKLFATLLFQSLPAFAENTHVVDALSKGYVAIVSTDRINQSKKIKLAIVQEAADRVCAHEVKPYGAWKARKWTLYKTYEHNKDNGIGKTRRNRFLMRVAHKIFETVTCTSNFSLGEMMRLEQMSKLRPSLPPSINRLTGPLSSIVKIEPFGP